jgi:type III pantothenate kinase
MDQGNTLLKAGVFNHHQLIAVYSAKKLSKQFIDSIVSKHPIDALMLSSVSNLSEPALQYVKQKGRFLQMHAKIATPIINDYKTPLTLGSDRLANAAGAWQLFPKQNSLVLDAGTCLKYDLITAKGHYKGGAISPGIHMRYRALNRYTSRLPLVNMQDTMVLTGYDTTSSIVSGVQQGILAEAEYLIAQYRKQYNRLKVIITGGDGKFFADRLKSHIFAAPDLTITGLNSILLHNLKKPKARIT